MKSIKLHAPATTANVGPGYDIFAMAHHEPYDEITISLTNSKDIKIEIYGDSQNIPVNVTDNTAGLAILELFKRKNIQQGVLFQLYKNMPSGGGLGTTGASAAAAIVGLNKLLDLSLSDNEMVDIARYGEVASGGSPHADNVAAAILGGFVLVKNYHPIDVVKLDLPEFHIVLAAIRKSQRSTRGFITYEIGQEKLKEQMARCASVIHAIHTKDVKEFGRAISVDYIAEPVRSAVIPEYTEVKLKVLEAGAHGFNISGGGSSVFCVCDANNQNQIAEIMHQGFQNNPNFVKVIQTKTSNQGVKIVG
ncbi:MAG: homoserine kinase [Bacteroidetes bacterium RIFOXYA12_FULL_35_11]|nr:MAG: homoserine kinase [Bacteroidetes bacterium GWF2_35_48]OFY74204.1 MAG: homoserine kinase [Bacteroidetes bacterium RIFOXYA12_FULL_35_11]OFY93782.1 MAG: homoserine kinase [Bacteroidetes bacterium RIFOXYC12_FULL_35_7]HBX52393.1 homoserine kinase [Bacteroidales bacterium]